MIDLGPEGGDAGGYVVTTGTPEQVAKVPESHTGRYLGEVLATRPDQRVRQLRPTKPARPLLSGRGSCPARLRVKGRSRHLV